jgi:hypothetical protein
VREDEGRKRWQRLQEKDSTHMRCEAMVPCMSSRRTIHFVLLADEPTRRLHGTRIAELMLKRRTITLMPDEEEDWWRSREWEKIELVPHTKTLKREGSQRLPEHSYSLSWPRLYATRLRLM